jgi:dihydrofolate reductase
MTSAQPQGSNFLALNISVSRDGFMAGPNQSEENPLGENGTRLHEWVFKTLAFREWIGLPGGEEGVDNDYAARGFDNIGATIMGRNMFTPSRGPWIEDGWQGWWGPEPKFQHPVFILTHFAKPRIDMGNGTVFHFVTGGVAEAVALAGVAAQGKVVRVGGGADVLHQFLEAGLLDEIHTVQAPVSLGSGELLFSNPDLQLKHYRAVEPVESGSVLHQTYIRI